MLTLVPIVPIIDYHASAFSTFFIYLVLNAMPSFSLAVRNR